MNPLFVFEEKKPFALGFWLRLRYLKKNLGYRTIVPVKTCISNKKQKQLQKKNRYKTNKQMDIYIYTHDSEPTCVYMIDVVIDCRIGAPVQPGRNGVELLSWNKWSKKVIEKIILLLL